MQEIDHLDLRLQIIQLVTFVIRTQGPEESDKKELIC